jgi:translation elongation factor EF-G
MEEVEEFKKSSKSHNPGLRALLSIKHFAATLEKDYAKLLEIETELDELNQRALVIIEANSSPEAADDWKLVIPEINKAVIGINAALTSAKEKTVNNEKEGYTEFWKQLSVQVTELKQNYKDATNKGLELLPEKIHPQWEKDFVTLASQVESLVKHVDTCRVLLQMIERYTPDELNAITQIIADKVPLDFTYEEAMEYQNDYYKALINFKKEFKQEKNLWDKFLDILAGGTHQSPSERVMMERWLDGDKGDL